MIGKLAEFLKKNKIDSPSLPHLMRHLPQRGRRIRKIYVNKGPGSFVGIRVGAAMAQALGFAWKIPVKFLETAEFTRIFTLKKMLISAKSAYKSAIYPRFLFF